MMQLLVFIYQIPTLSYFLSSIAYVFHDRGGCCSRCDRLHNISEPHAVLFMLK